MILYLIPARGGSKRLPGKNLRKLAGIPLVAWAIRRAQGAARLVGGESRVVVSTDSEEIASVSREWGAEVLTRPAEYATDDATSGAVIYHALETLFPTGPDEFGDMYRPDRLVLVQPTSPLALSYDVACAVGMSLAKPSPGAVYSYSEGSDDGPPNGAAYVYNTKRGFPMTASDAGTPMPAARSIDIDTEDDWHIAEALLAARPVAPFSIAGREIGPGRPCFIIAEAGINHGGDPEKAHALVDAASDAGADAVKFQTFDPEKLAEPGPHLDLLRKVHLPCKEYEALKAHAESRGLIFLSSPFDEQSVDMLDSIGVPAFKIPSGEIVNLPLLRHVASKGKPVILSTGMSTMREVAAAVDALEGVPLALLHCVSEYPARLGDPNFRAIATMRQAFGLPIGWSDHFMGEGIAVDSVALGACIVEKHLCLSGYDGPDADVSIAAQDFSEMVSLIRGLEINLGTGEKVPTLGELETAKVARRRDGLRRNAG